MTNILFYTVDLQYIAGIGHQIFLHLNSGIMIPCLYNNLINLAGLPIWQLGENCSLKCKYNRDEIWNTVIKAIELQPTVVTT